MYGEEEEECLDFMEDLIMIHIPEIPHNGYEHVPETENGVYEK